MNPTTGGKLSNAYELGFAGKLLKSSTVSYRFFPLQKTGKFFTEKLE
jgi:hypothetical protein